MSSVVRRVIVGLVVVGFVSSASSSYVHYQLAQDPGYTSFCDVSESVSCTQVYESRFGSVGGVPVALLGAFWFGLVGLLTITAGRGDAGLDENIGAYLLMLSTVGLAAVLFLGYESFVVLGTLCVLCAVVYVAVIGVFVAASAVTTAPLMSMPRRLGADIGRLVKAPLALGIAGGYVVLTVAVGLAFTSDPTDITSVSATNASSVATRGASDDSEFERFWSAQPRVELPVGVDGAQVLVLKFNDYQCPSCAQSYFLYEPIFARYEFSHPGAVRQLSLDYPLDPECNDQTPRGGHMGACEAAVAVRLARREGRDTAMARWLYENQLTMSRETVRQGLADVASMTDFDQLYETVLEEVKADIALGALIDIEATPTFVINGVVIKGGLQPQLFDSAIALELAADDNIATSE